MGIIKEAAGPGVFCEGDLTECVVKVSKDGQVTPDCEEIGQMWKVTGLGSFSSALARSLATSAFAMMPRWRIEGRRQQPGYKGSAKSFVGCVLYSKVGRTKTTDKIYTLFFPAVLYMCENGSFWSLNPFVIKMCF